MFVEISNLLLKVQGLFDFFSMSQLCQDVKENRKCNNNKKNSSNLGGIICLTKTNK